MVPNKAFNTEETRWKPRVDSEDKFNQSLKRPETQFQLSGFLPEVLKKNVPIEIIELVS